MDMAVIHNDLSIFHLLRAMLVPVETYWDGLVRWVMVIN
jgi:hypothetical protein